MLAALGAAAAGLLPQELSLMHIGGRQDTGNSVELPQPHLTDLIYFVLCSLYRP
jgi:hypothetical protein